MKKRKLNIKKVIITVIIILLGIVAIWKLWPQEKNEDRDVILAAEKYSPIVMNDFHRACDFKDVEVIEPKDFSFDANGEYVPTNGEVFILKSNNSKCTVTINFVLHKGLYLDISYNREAITDGMELHLDAPLDTAKLDVKAYYINEDKETIVTEYDIVETVKEEGITTYTLSTEYENLESKQVSFDVVDTSVNSTIDTNQGNIKTVPNPDSTLVLVNRKNALPSDYVPDLKEIPEGYSVASGYRGKPEAVDHFVLMVDTMYEETGLWMYNTSSYRSYETQVDLYNNYVNNYGQEEADTFSAKPGTSEHQTGLVMDVLTSDAIMDDFGTTPQHTWVKENAYRFGFIIRYTEENREITGYMPEPWHLRYVGQEAAEAIYNSGDSLEEYLGQ